MVFRTLVTRVGAKRIPLIKFRNGANAQAAANQASSGPPHTVEAQYSAQVIEDWELPPRFARKPITADEMEYINRGGPA